MKFARTRSLQKPARNLGDEKKIAKCEFVSTPRSAVLTSDRAIAIAEMKISHDATKKKAAMDKRFENERFELNCIKRAKRARWFVRAQLDGVEHPTCLDVAAFKATFKMISERSRVASERKRAKDEDDGAEFELILINFEPSGVEVLFTGLLSQMQHFFGQ